MLKSPCTAEFRAMVSQQYLDGADSYSSLANKSQISKQTLQQWVAKYNISSRSVLRHWWILSYNAHMELKDYYPQQEVYMAQAHRKTTLEQRQEIVTYCLQKGLS